MCLSPETGLRWGQTIFSTHMRCCTAPIWLTAKFEGGGKALYRLWMVYTTNCYSLCVSLAFFETFAQTFIATSDMSQNWSGGFFRRKFAFCIIGNKLSLSQQSAVFILRMPGRFKLIMQHLECSAGKEFQSLDYQKPTNTLYLSLWPGHNQQGLILGLQWTRGHKPGN